MHIEYYLQLFDDKGIPVDSVDKQYMRDLLAETDRFGVSNPRLCELCPNCYRPFKIENGEPDTINRAMYIFEVVSYTAFKIVVWPTLLIILAFPANVARLVDFIHKNIVAKETEEEENEKTATSKTEGNAEYRSKAREASKVEEEVSEVVKRIDGNVQKLETELLGQRPRPIDAQEGVSSEITLERDEFDVKVDKLRAEMNRRFEEIADMLQIALRRQQQAETAGSNNQRVLTTGPEQAFYE